MNWCPKLFSFHNISVSVTLSKETNYYMHFSGTNICLYYYSSPVRKNLSSKFDRFLTVHSHFDTNYSVDFYAHTYCQSATFVHPLFAFVLSSLRQKIKKNLAYIATDAIFRCNFFRCSCRIDVATATYEKLRTTAHNFAQLCQARGKAGAGWSTDHPEFLPCFDFFVK